MATQYEERHPYKTLELNGITYVPHYLNETVYVGPAYDTTGIAYSPEYLRRKGAVEYTAHLWRRATTGIVKNVIA